ncbi:MAG: thioredoxin [Anaerolineaceae bacterium]|nr:thioredoxin [Anaerolineaceae bacterium]
MGSKTFEATTENFASEVLGADTPVLVDFWAEWCGPCKMIAPIVDQLADDYEGRLKVGKLDADANPDVVIQYGVMGIPTLILFNKGEVVNRVTGFKPRECLIDELGLAGQIA